MRPSERERVDDQSREARIDRRRRELRQDPDAIAWGGLRYEAEFDVELEDDGE